MSEVISPKNCMTGMLRVNTVGTIFWYLWFPLVFFDETLGPYVIEVEKKDPEVELPVGGRTSGFQKIAVLFGGRKPTNKKVRFSHRIHPKYDE